MKKRNKLLFLGVLFTSATLAACSSSMDTKGKGIAQLMNDNQERVFYLVNDFNDDDLPGKDERITYVYFTKSGKLKGYEIGGKTVGSGKEIRLDDVAGKSIDEIRNLAEENSRETFEVDNVTARVETDSSGNNTTKESITLSLYQGKPSYWNFQSLTTGQIRDKYYAGYNSGRRNVSSASLLITEVSKGNVINFDKADGKIITEKK